MTKQIEALLDKLMGKTPARRGRASKNKGKVGEREVAEVLRKHGWEAKRGVQHQGGADSPDVAVAGDDFPFHVEVKRTETLALWKSIEQAVADAPKDKVPLVVHRPSRRKWVAILDLEDLLELIKRRDDA